jgi:hypothetical protein
VSLTAIGKSFARIAPCMTQGKKSTKLYWGKNMPKKTIETYEIKAKIIIRKDYLKRDFEDVKDSFNMENLKALLKDRIEMGIETPVEEIDVEIIE